MRTFKRLLPALFLALTLGACGSGGGGGSSSPQGGSVAVTTQTLDTLAFGQASSESSHGLVTGFSSAQASVAPLPSNPSTGDAADTITGQFGLNARRLLPRTPNGDYYGGEMSFQMNVDPVALNYFTIKTWGTDWSPSWMVLNVEGLEVGWRHDYGATDEMMFHSSSGWYPGGFIYRTMRLPYHLTRGKTSVTIKLRSLGQINYYISGSYNDRQTRMSQPTVPVYAAYTHTGAQPDVSGEQQGTVLAGKARSAESGDNFIASWKNRVNSSINSKLAAAANTLTPDDLQVLAQSYSVSWSTGYQNAAVVTQVRDGLDALTRAYAAAPTTYLGSFGNSSWGGYLGPAGDAARLLKLPLTADLDATVDFGGSVGSTTRRTAWSTAVRAAVDYGRTHRLGISNQMQWAAWPVYLGNRALLELLPSMALKEPEARRYLYEVAGLSPWLGDDQPGGGDTPVRGTAPYGPNWYPVTSDGTTKEDCLVGGDYGEVGSVVVRWGVSLGDNALIAQGAKMLRARAALRYPGQDTQGWQAFVAAEPIGCRNDYEMNWHVTYLGRSEVSDLLSASLGPTVIGNDLVGHAQQAVAEGNFYSRMWNDPITGWNDSVHIPDYYDRFKVLAPTGVKLPMGNGEADFAWADRENMAVAAKHGNERFWAVLNWRGAVAMNRLARVFVTTPQNSFVAEVGIDDVQYTPAGRTYVADARVDGSSQDTPPDNPVNANNGQSYAVAMRADLTSEPSNNRDSGRADAYTLRYGHWLVGLNAHPSRPYTMKMPVGFTSGVDLASGKTYNGAVTLPPKSFVVFYLPSATNAAVSPSNPLQPTALAGGAVALTWESTPGGASYTISRASAVDGPYSVVATGITGTSYTTTSNSAGASYYQVQAVDSQGNASGPSPRIFTSTTATPLCAPWSDIDMGTVSATGSAACTAAGITINGSGADIWGSADDMNYAFRPMLADGTVIARVVSQGATNSWAKAGVMIRESLAQNSRHAMVAVSPTNGAQMAWRTSTGGATAGTALTGYQAPTWVKLVRSGNTFTGYLSTDGSTWTLLSSTTLSMPQLVYVGLAVTAHTSDGKLSTAVFDNLTLPTLP